MTSNKRNVPIYDSNRQIEHLTGIEGAILNILSEKMNFKPIYTAIGSPEARATGENFITFLEISTYSS